MTVTKGDLLIAYPEERLAHRVVIEVTRVARDGSWADIVCSTWAVQWRKRQPLPLHYTRPASVDEVVRLIRNQEADHMAMLREEGRIA